MPNLAELPFPDTVPLEVRKSFASATEVIPEAAVNAAADRVAVAITVDLQDKNPVLLAVLHGGLYFAGMLLQRMIFPLEQGYVQVARYRDRQAGGALEWVARNHPDLAGREVLFVDDVLDKGETMLAIEDWARAQGAERVSTAVLVRKDVSGVEARAAYVGLECDDRFLVGCGMDFAGYGRNLPGIYAL